MYYHSILVIWPLQLIPCGSVPCVVTRGVQSRQGGRMSYGSVHPTQMERVRVVLASW